MKQDWAQYIGILADNRLFAGIDRERLCAMLEAMDARIARYDRGGTIYQYGDTVRDLAIVLEGAVAVEADDAEGANTNLNLLTVGDEFGSFLLLSGKTRSPMRVYAAQRCKLMLMDVRRVQAEGERSEENWQLMNNLLVIFANKCVDLYQKVQIYGQKRVRSRIRMYLMTLERSGDEVILPVSRTALASYLGVDRTALAREFGRMREEGLIAVSRRRVKLLNRDFFQIADRPRGEG